MGRNQPYLLQKKKNVFCINFGIPGNSRQVSFPIPHHYQVYDYDRVKDKRVSSLNSESENAQCTRLENL